MFIILTECYLNIKIPLLASFKNKKDQFSKYLE